ncbi:MAG: serine/threonine-protein kinase [Planctomycetota bacterium]
MAEESRLEELFTTVVSLPAEQRHEFLRRECGEELDLFESMQRLLASHDKNETDAAFILNRVTDVESSGVDSVPAEDLIGQQLGRYRIIEKIGEGGMGVVFGVEQVTGVKRRFALKVVGAGVVWTGTHSQEAFDRFKVEAGLLSLLDHPNIARIIDFGLSSEDRPFLVMELVDGISIVDYCRQEKTDLTSRLRMFVTLCKAIQHAHQQGVLHLDLKPSNVLVSKLDGRPNPVVIDFGIARAVELTVNEKESGQITGTPRYMSPEQTRIRPQKVDTRSDIYSLGVLLYEIVAHVNPFAAVEAGSNPVAVIEQIRSHRIQPLSDTAHYTPDESAQFSNRRLRKELDAVVFKALAAQVEERYQTAGELARDVENFIAGDRVQAVDWTRGYEAQIAWRKHRVLFVSVSVVAAILLIASGLCLSYALDANRSRGETFKANLLLEEKVSDLEAANNRIRDRAEEVLYESAHSMAFDKFALESFSEVVSVGRNLFPKHFQEDSEVDPEEFLEIDIYLLVENIPYREILETSIVRIEDAIEEHQIYTSRLYDEEYASEGSIEYRRLQTALAEKVPMLRVMLFRTLLREYKHVFGNDDPRNDEVVLLLCASLIDRGELAEAEGLLLQLNERITGRGETVNQGAPVSLLLNEIADLR